VSVGAYPVTGTRARTVLEKADASDVCRLDIIAIYLARAVVLGELIVRSRKKDV
jgi:hypothetical protein